MHDLKVIIIKVKHLNDIITYLYKKLSNTISKLNPLNIYSILVIQLLRAL